MNEVEVKFLEIDKAALERKLQSLGAKKVFEGIITPFYFDFPNGSLRARNKVLRLRKKGSLVEFAIKEKKKSFGAKVAEETEVIVSDFENTRKILLSLGFREYARLPKKRISYALGPVHYELDTYDGMPTFLEVEAHSIKELKWAVNKLGFILKEAKPWSGREVLKHYGKK
jgi:adenylate cyclase class 2